MRIQLDARAPKPHPPIPQPEGGSRPAMSKSKETKGDLTRLTCVFVFDYPCVRINVRTRHDRCPAVAPCHRVHARLEWWEYSSD